MRRTLLVQAPLLDQATVQDPFDCLSADQSGFFNSFIVRTWNVLDVVQVYGAGCATGTSLPLQLGLRCLRTCSFIEKLLVAAWTGGWLILVGGFLRSGIVRIGRWLLPQPVVIGCGASRTRAEGIGRHGAAGRAFDMIGIRVRGCRYLQRGAFCRVLNAWRRRYGGLRPIGCCR